MVESVSIAEIRPLNGYTCKVYKFLQPLNKFAFAFNCLAKQFPIRAIQVKNVRKDGVEMWRFTLSNYKKLNHR